MSSSLSKYLAACQQHIEELTHSLTEDDLTTLHKELVALGENDWLRWYFSNLREIETFLQATPTVRSRHKAWQNQSLRLRLTYGAIRYAKASESVLTVLHESTWLDCASVASYRDMTASAAELFYRMQEQIDDPEVEFPDLDFPRRMN